MTDDLMDDKLDVNDDESSEGEDHEGGGGFNAKKIVMFVVVPLFILIGGGAGLYFSGVLDGLLGKGHEAGEKVADDGYGAGHGTVGSAHFLEIPNIKVNLKSPDAQPRYLMLQVVLELENEQDKLAVESVMPRVIDQIQTYLRELQIKDLRGSQGLYRLEIEMLSRVNAAAYPVEVKAVLFQQVLIQ